jgi:hypothetical protein
MHTIPMRRIMLADPVALQARRFGTLRHRDGLVLARGEATKLSTEGMHEFKRWLACMRA